MDKLKFCPFCGSSNGVEYIDYNQAIKYTIDFNGNSESVDVISYRKSPVFGKCINCRKRIKLSNIMR